MLKKFATNSRSAVIISWLIIAAGFLLISNPALAQNKPPIDLKITPPTYYVAIEPGKSYTHRVTLEQEGSLPLLISASFVDFKSDGISGQPVLDTAASFPYLRFISPEANDQGQFTLNPGQKQQLAFKIEIPNDAHEGEFPLTLLFSARPNSEVIVGGSGSQVSATIGSNLIVNLNRLGHDRGDLQIEDVKTTLIHDSLFPLSFTALARNEGQNATTATGSAQITDYQGNILAEYQVYPDMILADSQRQLRSVSGEIIIDKNLDPTQISKHFLYDQPFLIGPYTFSLTLSKNGQYPDSSTTITKTVWVLPYSVGAIFLILLGFYTTYQIWFRKFSKKQFWS